MAAFKQTHRTIEEGRGYWDVSHYPYGGSFHRIPFGVALELVKAGCGKYPTRESMYRLADGRTIIIDNCAVEAVSA